MLIKEFEALTLKECLQQVRSAMGNDAVILETRKSRKGGILGLGAHDAVAIVAATGITVSSDLDDERGSRHTVPVEDNAGVAPDSRTAADEAVASAVRTASPGRAASKLAARSAYAGKAPGRQASQAGDTPRATEPHAAVGVTGGPVPPFREAETKARDLPAVTAVRGTAAPEDALKLHAGINSTDTEPATAVLNAAQRPTAVDDARLTYLERAMGEIRECLRALQREQYESNERTVSAVVSAVAPAVSAVHAAGLVGLAEPAPQRFPDLQTKLNESGVSHDLSEELIDQLPDMGAWSEEAQQALVFSAMRDLISRRVSSTGGVQLTPGRLKAVALIGPTGVGKTTTIAKLAAHFALVAGKRVALLTVDTYRIAAIEQLRTYSQIIGLPLSVAYNHAEVMPIVDEYADFDLLLIDTAGRSQKHIVQVGELKSLLDALNCETHLVLSSQTREQDMLEAAHRFSAARVDRLIFSKLDETSTYGPLLNIADRTGIPLSYLTTGQKVPEDLEIADGSRLADLILE